MSSDTDGVIVHDTLCLSDEDVNSSVTSGISSASDNLNIGQPSVNYYVYESFYYSHNYFRRGPEGLEVAECLLCLRDKKEDRNPFKKRKLNVKTTNGSPKGMIAHLNAFHPEYNEKISQQKLVHEQKKSSGSVLLLARLGTSPPLPPPHPPSKKLRIELQYMGVSIKRLG